MLLVSADSMWVPPVRFSASYSRNNKDVSSAGRFLLKEISAQLHHDCKYVHDPQLKIAARL